MASSTADWMEDIRGDSDVVQRSTVSSVIMTLVTVVTVQAVFIFLLAIWKASIFQRNLLFIGLLYGLIYPVIHVAAMWATMGPGNIVKRQLLAFVTLIGFFGSSSVAAVLVLKKFRLDDLDNSIAEIMSKRGGMNLTTHIYETSCTDAVLEMLLAIPLLFVLCQIPYWIYVAFRNQTLCRGEPRERSRLEIWHLLFFTAMAAVSFACLSASMEQPIRGESKLTTISYSVMSHTIYVCFSFLFACLPLMVFLLGNRRKSLDQWMRRLRNKPKKAADPRIAWAVLGCAAVVYLLGPTLMSYRIFAKLGEYWIFPILFYTICFPYSLLLMQLRRFGYRICECA